MQRDRENLETCIKNAPGESSEERTVCMCERGRFVCAYMDPSSSNKGQSLVNCMSPVEVFATEIKILIGKKFP